MIIKIPDNYRKNLIDQYDFMRVKKAIHDIEQDLMENKIRVYFTTVDTCRCPDHAFRGKVCKHMIGAMILRDIKGITFDTPGIDDLDMPF